MINEFLSRSNICHQNRQKDYITLKPQSALGVQRFSIGLPWTGASPPLEGRTAWFVWLVKHKRFEAWRKNSWIWSHVLVLTSGVITWLYLVSVTLVLRSLRKLVHSQVAPSSHIIDWSIHWRQVRNIVVQNITHCLSCLLLLFFFL